MNRADVDFVITHPGGYELDKQFAGDARVTHNQREAFEGADFIYAKNWSFFTQYGQILSRDRNWTVNAEKMKLTNGAVHALPARTPQRSRNGRSTRQP